MSCWVREGSPGHHRHAVSVAEGREGASDEAAVELLAAVREALGEDLNAPAALAAVDAWAVKALADTTVGGGALVRDILAARLGWSSKMASSVMEELYAFRPYDREAVDALAAEMLAEVRAYEAQKEA